MNDEKTENETNCEVGQNYRNESNNRVVDHVMNDGNTFTRREGVGRKRRRPRTKAFRIHIKDEIEKALCSRLSPLHHIAFTVDGNGRLNAPLDDVVASLGLDGDRYRALSRTALAKLGDISTLFSVDCSADIRPRLCINDSKTNCDKSTVYVDNLPRDCDVVSLYRRAATFGTLVSLHPLFVSRNARNGHSSSAGDDQSPSSSAAPLPSAVQRVQAAFIQFVEEQSAIKFCEAYSRNLPGRNLYKRRKIRKAKRNIAGKRRCRAFAGEMARQGAITEMKKSRKRKRASDIANEESPLKRSRSSLDMSECSDNIDVQRRDSREDGLCAPTSDINVTCHTSDDNSLAITGSGTLHLQRNKRRRRVKKRRRTKFKPKYRVLNLTRYFRRMQVLSLETFKELRTKYLLLKKESFKKLKADLVCADVPSGFVGECGRDRRRKRGKAKLMSRVSRLRERHDESVQCSSSTVDIAKTDEDSKISDNELRRIVDGHELS